MLNIITILIQIHLYPSPNFLNEFHLNWKIKLNIFKLPQFQNNLILISALWTAIGVLH